LAKFPLQIKGGKLAFDWLKQNIVASDWLNAPLTAHRRRVFAHPRIKCMFNFLQAEFSTRSIILVIPAKISSDLLEELLVVEKEEVLELGPQFFRNWRMFASLALKWK
jgi:hypothetical protein